MVNYLNERSVSMWNSQLFFCITEIPTTFILSLMLDKEYFNNNHKKHGFKGHHHGDGGDCEAAEDIAGEESRAIMTNAVPPLITLRTASVVMFSFSLLHILLALPEKVIRYVIVVFVMLSG